MSNNYSIRNCDVNAFAQFDYSVDKKKSDHIIPELARSPLHMATLIGMYELVQVLISSNRVYINQQVNVFIASIKDCMNIFVKSELNVYR